MRGGDDDDIECTCDVGPFASCPACGASRAREIESRAEYRRKFGEQKQERKPFKGESLVDVMLHYQRLAKEEKR